MSDKCTQINGEVSQLKERGGGGCFLFLNKYFQNNTF